MLLLCLLVVAQGAPPRPQDEHSLASYLTVAALYRSADHTAALEEIRKWPIPAVNDVVAEILRQERRVRAIPTRPGEIALGTVEDAALMHAEAGLLAMQQTSAAEADVHLRASTSLFECTRRAAAAARDRAGSGAAPDGRNGRAPAGPGKRPRIDRRDFYHALAASALALAVPQTALSFALRAREEAPLDPEVQLVYGCAAESLAEGMVLGHRASEAGPLRDRADRSLRDAVALDPGMHEARLHLGKVLLAAGRRLEARSVLEEVERASADDRQRYLARLFLGRVAEGSGRPDEAARLYAGALELWPDSQAARLALAYAAEKEHGPAAALPVVGATLSASRRLGRAADPWWLYPFGPPGLAQAALARLFQRALGP